jgi:hypothetical protein
MHYLFPARIRMFRITLLFLALCLAATRQTSAAKARKISSEAATSISVVTLKSFVDMTLVDGFLAKLPGPIAEHVGVERETPYYGLAISSDQATDGMFHSFQVITDSSEDPKPVILLLGSTYKWPGNVESYSYRVSLGGKLERVVVNPGKLDEYGRSIKGSGGTIEKDINAPEIKERFQHELDLWLKRTHLKKEWRSTKFSWGSLKKTK